MNLTGLFQTKGHNKKSYQRMKEFDHIPDFMHVVLTMGDLRNILKEQRVNCCEAFLKEPHRNEDFAAVKRAGESIINGEIPYDAMKNLIYIVHKTPAIGPTIISGNRNTLNGGISETENTINHDF